MTRRVAFIPRATICNAPAAGPTSACSIHTNRAEFVIRSSLVIALGCASQLNEWSLLLRRVDNGTNNAFIDIVDELDMPQLCRQHESQSSTDRFLVQPHAIENIAGR